LNPLIPIHRTALQDEPVPTVNARDLHAFLEVGKDFSTWVKDRIRQYGFVAGNDYIIVEILSSPVSGSAKARPQLLKDYHLSLDMAKELSMVERNAKGKQARQYFIECERRAKLAAQASASNNAAALLNDPATMRGLLLTYSERLIDLEAKVEEQAPKVEFHDAVADSRGGQTIQEIAKVLDIGPHKLFAFLRSDGMLMANNLPYQAHIVAGHLVVVETVSDDAGHKRAHARVLVTGKGLIYLQKRLRRASLAGRAENPPEEDAP